MDPSDTLKLHLKYIQSQRQQIDTLRGRVERLEQLWAMTIGDPNLKWLYDNRSERMDPGVPIFDQGRAEFHLDRYRFAAKRVKGKTVADIACGTGYGCRLLVEEGGAAQVKGVDISEEAIGYAREKHDLAGTSFVIAPGEATGLDDESFDVVVSFETIEHVADDAELLTEFFRILKPEGVLICSTPNQWPLEIAPHHVRVYDRSAFEQVLEEKFEVIEMFNQNSGTSFEFNRNQSRGIEPTTEKNAELAECFLAVCQKRG